MDRSSLKEKVIIAAIRFWVCGSTYFMVGMSNTVLGVKSYIDTLIILSVALIFSNSAIVKPLQFYLFNSIDTEKTSNLFKLKTVFEDAFIIILCVFFIINTYYYINIFAIKIFSLPLETVVLPTEPILFGVFFVIYYYLFTFIKKLVMKTLSMLNK